MALVLPPLQVFSLAQVVLHDPAPTAQAEVVVGVVGVVVEQHPQRPQSVGVCLAL